MDLDEDVKQGEDLRLTNLLHKLSCADTLVPNKAEIKAEIESAVEEHGAPLSPLCAHDRRQGLPVPTRPPPNAAQMPAGTPCGC